MYKLIRFSIKEPLKEGSYSFDEFYKEYQPQIFNALRRLWGDVHWCPKYNNEYFFSDKTIPNSYWIDIDDISQEIFLKIWRLWDNINWEMKFHVWLSNIATSVTVDYLRCHKNKTSYRRLEEKDPCHALEQIVDEESTTDAVKKTENEEEIARVSKNVDKLNKREREVFDMLYVYNRGQKEAAKELGISHSALRVRLLRLRRKIDDR